MYLELAMYKINGNQKWNWNKAEIKMNLNREAANYINHANYHHLV